MDIHEAKRILQTISFLHYKFDMREEASGQITLLISLDAPDTRNRSQVMNFIHAATMSLQYLDYKEFVHYVFERVMNTLRHEAGELFMVNGVDVYNQHEDEHQKLHMVAAMYTKEFTLFGKPYPFNKEKPKI